jgi:hypothetical protein
MAISARAATLTGTILDDMGAVIPDARVIIHWDAVGLDSVKENVGTKDDKIAITNQSGQFSVELPPGVYDVFVEAAGFSPHCEKVPLKGKQFRPYKAQLKVSRMLKTQLDSEQQHRDVKIYAFFPETNGFPAMK